MDDEPRTQGQHLNPTVKKALMKEIKENLFKSGFDWNKSAMARKYGTSHKTITTLIQKINSRAKHIDYEAMQINRLEKNRQLLLEELNELRNKKKPRSHILRELRETEKSIADERRKAGMSDNKEVFKFEGETKSETTVNIGKILEKEIQAIQDGTKE